MADNQGKGWHGDSEGHAEAGSQSSGNQGNPQQHSEAGKKGGQAVQQSGNAHEFTEEERSEGGQQ